MRKRKGNQNKHKQEIQLKKRMRVILKKIQKVFPDAQYMELDSSKALCVVSRTARPYLGCGDTFVAYNGSIHHQASTKEQQVNRLLNMFEWAMRNGDCNTNNQGESVLG